MPLLVGVLAVVLATAGIMALAAGLGGVTEVWVAAGDLQADRPLSATDVEAVEVAGVIEFEHLAVAEVSREELVGQMVPRVEVTAGTPLSAGQFHPPGEFVAVEPGSVTVALVLSRARVPAGVAEGDTVLLVGVPGSSSAGAVAADWPGTSPLEAEATVVTITEYGSGSDLALTVAVPVGIADDAAWLAAENRLAVAHVP
jgi:hypothetical protein